MKQNTLVVPVDAPGLGEGFCDGAKQFSTALGQSSQV